MLIAPNAGACFGVERAIRLTEKAIRTPAKSAVQTLGPLIHNAMVVSQLESQGVRVVERAEEIREGTVILRSHGVPQLAEKSLRDKGLKIIDATCPLVKKPQRIAQAIGSKGYFLVIVGDQNHPEVKGVLSYFGGTNSLVTYDPKDLDKISSDVTRVALLAQTTIEVSVFEAVVEAARARFEDVVSFNTICDATSIRQKEAAELVRNADVMVIVGGKNSSNTAKLVHIASAQGVPTHHVERMDELDPHWFEGKKRIGVTGGASTPQDYVDEVGAAIAKLLTAPHEVL